jgi:hypothetical protein|tara:strand:+ start:1375 stop:2082 length:708 start_codon:yes stop_codon:yes gene_type:complete
MRKVPYPNVTVHDVMCVAIAVHEDQGFIRSGQGYVDCAQDEGDPIEIFDNKTEIGEILNNKVLYTKVVNEYSTKATELVDHINGKLMIKKMTNNLNNFESNVVKALSEADVSKFSVSIIASLPHSVTVDKKREVVADKMVSLKHSSQYFGAKGKRYDIAVEVLDVKFIQSSNIYMITACYAKKDIIKFWWRDQPDLVDIIADKVIKIRGTVKNQEVSKYSDSKETMLNRVKILAI